MHAKRIRSSKTHVGCPSDRRDRNKRGKVTEEEEEEERRTTCLLPVTAALLRLVVVVVVVGQIRERLFWKRLDIQIRLTAVSVSGGAAI